MQLVLSDTTQVNALRAVIKNDAGGSKSYMELHRYPKCTFE